MCDGAGNEIDFIRDPHIAEHCNMMTGVADFKREVRVKPFFVKLQILN